MRKLLHISILSFCIVFFSCFFFLPIWHVLKGGVIDANGNFTLFYIGEIFRNPLYAGGLFNSLLLGMAATACSLAIALPLAWLTDRYDFFGKRFYSSAILMPMILAPFVGALGMQCIFGRYGAINAILKWAGIIAPGQEPDWFAGGFCAIVVLEALHLFPILYLNITAALANVDPMLLEAAEDNGCIGVKRFLKITLPLVMPGIFAGSTLVFLWSFTELGTPLMFNFSRVTSVQIFNGMAEIGTNPMPYALVTVMMLFVATIYLAVKWIFGNKSYATGGKAGRTALARPLQGWKNFAISWLFAVVCFIGILPHLGVLGLAFGTSWYDSILPAGLTLEHISAALGHNLTIPSIVNSMKYAIFAVLLAVALGVFIARQIVRGKGRLGWILDCAAMLPLAVPGLVLAFGYLVMTRQGCFFAFLDPVKNPTVLLVIAYAVRRLPYVVRSAVAGLQQTSVSFEEAAASLSATPGTTFRRITLPLIAANILAGALLAFSFSMLEVSDSLILATKAAFFPITKAIYELSSMLGGGIAIASSLGLWTMVFLGISLLAVGCLLGKKLGAIFR